MTVAALIVANVGLFLASGGASRIADGLEGLFGIDPAVIRGRAWELYGTTDSRGDDGAPLFPPWPEPVVGGDSPIALALMEAPDELVASRIETVHDRWAGPASEWFSHYSDALVNATRAEEERLRAIGDALTELADALEVTQWEALGLCMQVWGVLQFFGGIILATPTGLRSLILSVTGALQTLLSSMVTIGASIVPRLSAIAEAEQAIERANTGQRVRDMMPAFPSDPDDWFRRTDDPYN